MIRGLIIDLDNCVFDTKSMGMDVIAPVLAVLEEAGSVNFFKKEVLSQVKEDLWNFSFEDIVAKYGIPDSIAGKMRLAYCNLEAPPWSKCYGDVGLLSDIKLEKILVTSGYSKLQCSKIVVTGIEDLFDEIIIESNDDPLNRKGKLRIFQEVMEKYCWSCREVMVIGDNAFSELKAGKELGMITVQTLRPHVYSAEGFDHYVSGLDEIIELLKTQYPFCA
jgi:FMN phosphatase YigB (HAD superfamily)